MSLTNSKNMGSAALIALSLSACAAVTPYSSEFSCKSTDYGKCITVSDAYNEALGKSLEADGDTSAKPVNQQKRSRQKNDKDALLLHASSDYVSYENAVYQELTTLIENPVTPIVTPPKMVRTLILPYANGSGADHLYMPRFVYSILEESKFVMGDYLSAKPRNEIRSLITQGLTDGNAQASSTLATNAAGGQ